MRFMCAAASAERHESQVGTASTVRSFLLIQQEGPWGADALHESNLPGDVADAVDAACARAGVRPLLIRHHHLAGDGVRVFAARADVAGPWIETALLDDPAEVLDLDLAALGRGESVGLQPRAEPLFLVCTNGSHDLCCAAFGRPLAKSLLASHSADTWECSHVGGDRFAANLVVLPDGFYYGRVGPAEGAPIVDAHRGGHLDLAHLRGRCAYPFAVQAAAWHLRRRLHATGINEIVLERATRHDDVTAATFAHGHDAWQVRVRTSRGEADQLTCRSPRPGHPLQFELVDIAAVTR